MILRRYGSKLHSVELDFDPRALTEVGFRRDGDTALDADEFSAAYEKRDERELTATADGPVQDEAEKRLLDELERRVRELLDGLEPGEVLVIENERGDHPRTRDRKKERVVEGKNRLHFEWRIEPALRVGIYRSKEGT